MSQVMVKGNPEDKDFIPEIHPMSYGRYGLHAESWSTISHGPMTAVAGGNLWSPAPQPNDDDDDDEYGQLWRSRFL